MSACVHTHAGALPTSHPSIQRESIQTYSDLDFPLAPPTPQHCHLIRKKRSRSRISGYDISISVKGWILVDSHAELSDSQKPRLCPMTSTTSLPASEAPSYLPPRLFATSCLHSCLLFEVMGSTHPSDIMESTVSPVALLKSSHG